MADAPSVDKARRRQANYALFLLSVTSAVSFLDRAVIGLLIEPIKTTFSISDAEAGLLSGIAFVLVYCLFGLPFAWLTDRYPRKPILAGSLAIWTVGTLLGGLAASARQLFATRMLVGVGEAGGTPPAVSMIADLFDERERPQALSIYRAAGQAGLIVGLPFAGYLAAAWGWRAALVGLGAAGIPLVALVLAMREPARGAGEPGGCPKPAALSASLRSMFADPAVLLLLTVCTFFGIFGAISQAWVSAFFMRLHALDAAATGASFGLVLGVPAALGTLAGGALATGLMRRYGSQKMVLMALGAISALSAAPQAVFNFHADIDVVLIAGAIAAFFGCFWSGPLLSIFVGLVPANSRGLATALWIIAYSLLPGVLAPVGVGAISDALTAEYGAEALRLALTVQPVSLLIAGGLLLSMGRFARSAVPSSADETDFRATLQPVAPLGDRPGPNL